MLNRSIYSAEHELFRDNARRFFKTELEPHVEGWENADIVPREFWRKAGANGLLCCGIPEQYGGPGADFRYNMIVSEEIGYAIGGGSCGFALQSDITAYYVLHRASEALKRKWLPGMVTGDFISSIAMTEPGAGSDLQAVRATALRDGDEYVVNGQKTFITNGQNSDFVIVVCKTDPKLGAKGMSLVIVETDRPGFQRGRNLDKIGQKAADTSEMFFDNVRVPASNLIGEEGWGRVPDGGTATRAPDRGVSRLGGGATRLRYHGRLRQGAPGFRQASIRAAEYPVQARRNARRSGGRLGLSRPVPRKDRRRKDDHRGGRHRQAVDYRAGGQDRG